MSVDDADRLAEVTKQLDIVAENVDDESLRYDLDDARRSVTRVRMACENGQEGDA